MEWQPIETAPKDGIFIAYDLDIGVCLCERYVFEGELVFLATEIGSGACEYVADDCTHWMPLPEPPKD